MIRKQKKISSIKEAKIKAARYCAYQERTQEEVKVKMREIGCTADEAELVVAEMITEGFINEERYAKLFCSGKFRFKKWGREKIKYQLKQKNISDYCIKSGLKEIEEEEYRQTLEELVEKKLESLKNEHLLVKKDKTFKYLHQKGFETELIKKALDSVKIK